ncbi:MAG: hypothetical protein RI981_171 [Bacteroidota bacterium]|jgi:AraC-like DNA-binding protein
MYDFVPYLSFLTSGIGLFFICYLLLRYGKYPKIYGLIFIIFALVYMEFYLYALTSKHIYKMLFLLRSSNIFRIFLPSALYLYVRSMLLPINKLKALQYLHFTVPVLISIGILPDLFLSEEAKTAVLDNYYVNNKYFISIPVGWIPAGFMQPISIVFGIVYGGLTLVLIQMTRRKQGETYAHINKQTLTWLNLLASAVTIYFMLQLYQYINLFLNNSFDPPSQIIKCLLGILLFSYFISTPNVQENMDGCIVPKGKSLPSLEDLMPELLKEVIADNHAIEFDAQMKDLKAYLSSDYDLSSMAKSIDMPAAKLSKLIKKYYGISFVELINRLRIHYFLQQRASFNQYTLETYMYQSGFTNRSTFYAAFKKYVGVNPSYYLKEMNEAS